MRSLRYPALGLLLQLAGAFALADPLYLLMQSVVEDRGDLYPAGLLVVGPAMMLVTGLAIAYRPKLALAAFALWVVAAGATAYGAMTEFSNFAGARYVAYVVVAGLGGPVLVAVAPLLGFRLAERRATTDGAAALLVLALTALIAAPVSVIDSARWLASHAESTSAAINLIARGAGIAVAVLAVRAAVKIRRDPADRAAVTTYAIAAIGVTVGEQLLELFAAETDAVERVAGMALSSVTPLAIWLYVRRAEPGERADMPPAIAWVLLLAVPHLAAASLIVSDARTPLPGDAEAPSTQVLAAMIVLLATQAVILLVTGIATLRRDRGARVTALVAAIFSFAVFGASIAVFYAFESRMVPFKPVWPIALLVASTAALAWTSRD